MQKDREIADDLNYDGTEFLVPKKKISRIKTKNNIRINAFCYENKLTFPIYILNQKVESSIDLFLIIN